MNRRSFLASLVAVPAGLVAAAKASVAAPLPLNLDEIFDQLYAIKRNRETSRVSSHYTATIDDMLNHCRRTKDALAVVITPSTRFSYNCGILHRLRTIDGIARIGHDAKRRSYVWVKRDDGGWSMILFVACPKPEGIADKLRGIEPTYVMLEDECRRMDIDRIAMQQLGRREGSERNVCHFA